jgi:hypothetical protein|tara:strand:- start:61 stop:384 length:324 start_codon:yes stop_codon:yes gene_type:complete
MYSNLWQKKVVALAHGQHIRLKHWPRSETVIFKTDQGLRDELSWPLAPQRANQAHAAPNYSCNVAAAAPTLSQGQIVEADGDRWTVKITRTKTAQAANDLIEFVVFQ